MQSALRNSARRIRIDPYYKPFASQQRFHDLDTRIKGFSAPVGSGKTQALVMESLKLAYQNPKCVGLIGASTNRMGTDVILTAFLSTLEERRIPYKFIKSKSNIYLPECSSTIRFRSLRKPYLLVRQNLAWFACDELTYAPEDAWRRLEARLRDPHARHLCGIACWTPRGFDWVYRRFIGPDKIPGYGVVLATPYENRAILDRHPDYYERLKASYDERFYRQQVRGEYIDVSEGAIYYAFSEENIRRLEYNPALPLYWTLDFGVKPFSSLICQIEHLDEHRGVHRVNVLDEVVLNGYTPDACEEFARRVGQWAPSWQGIEVYLCGDPAGHQRHSSSRNTDWEQVRAFFELRPAFKIHDHVANVAPAVKDRTNSVNALLKNAAEERLLFIDPKCKELIADMREVMYARDRHGNTTWRIDRTDFRRTHAADALGYLSWALHEARPGRIPAWVSVLTCAAGSIGIGGRPKRFAPERRERRR